MACGPRIPCRSRDKRRIPCRPGIASRTCYLRWVSRCPRIPGRAGNYRRGSRNPGCSCPSSRAGDRRRRTWRACWTGWPVRTHRTRRSRGACRPGSGSKALRSRISSRSCRARYVRRIARRSCWASRVPCGTRIACRTRNKRRVPCRSCRPRIACKADISRGPCPPGRPCPSRDSRSTQMSCRSSPSSWPCLPEVTCGASNQRWGSRSPSRTCRADLPTVAYLHRDHSSSFITSVNGIVASHASLSTTPKLAIRLSPSSTRPAANSMSRCRLK